MIGKTTTRSLRLLAPATVALVLAAASPATAQTRYGTVQRGDGGTCCLTNFRYTGPCEVTLGAGESCGDALAYLNNMGSVGRGYCGNSIIRGGWTLVPCDQAGGGVYASPSDVTAREPATAHVTGTMQPIRPSSGEVAPRGGGTFITPTQPSQSLKATEPGLINL